MTIHNVEATNKSGVKNMAGYLFAHGLSNCAEVVQ